MALIKEPYGLVYNTDGTLCTTYRDDVVPFRGVRSFAVEEGTTNWFSYPLNQEYSGGSLRAAGSYYATSGYKITATNQPSSGALPGCRVDVGANQKVTVSGYTNLSWVEIFRRGFDASGGGVFAQTHNYVTPDSRGFFSFTFDTGTNAALAYVHVGVGNTHTANFWLEYVQVEIKPFATSFVDGSRPKGRLEISVDDLKFDIANDDWVISYWKYPVATHDNTQNGYNICTLGQYTNNNSKGYIWWGKDDNKNKFNVVVILNDATGMGNSSNNTFNPTDYFYHWHYEVLKKQGKVLSYYVDGVKQCELIIPADKKLQTPFDVGLSYPTNALIAAPYYGYNSATWTDEYIREVYEAKIPYPAQNKLSIY